MDWVTEDLRLWKNFKLQSRAALGANRGADLVRVATWEVPYILLIVAL